MFYNNVKFRAVEGV